jgi:hypothetical protein
MSIAGNDGPGEPSRMSRRWREILASAYELTEEQIAQDAGQVRRWHGSDENLIAALEHRHGRNPDSELGPYFLAALRHALP